MENIILIGMPGAGKSTVGVVLAKILGFDFVDSDIVIQRQVGKRLCDILEEEGLEAFLETENRINSGLNLKKTVIATGGSVVYGKEAMAHLKSIGAVIYLQLSCAAVERRLGDLKRRGVAMKEGESLRELYEERSDLYEKYADYILDCNNLTIEETIAQAVELCRSIAEV
jgi:shikimate kinase